MHYAAYSSLANLTVCFFIINFFSNKPAFATSLTNSLIYPCSGRAKWVKRQKNHHLMYNLVTKCKRSIEKIVYKATIAYCEYCHLILNVNVQWLFCSVHTSRRWQELFYHIIHIAPFYRSTSLIVDTLTYQHSSSVLKKCQAGAFTTSIVLWLPIFIIWYSVLISISFFMNCSVCKLMLI